MRKLLLLLALALFTLPAWASWSLVTGQKTTCQTFGTTLTCALPANTTAGNQVNIFLLVEPSTATASCTGFTAAVNNADSGSTTHVYIFYAFNVAGGTATVSCALAGSPSFAHMNVAEFSGGQTSSDPLDKTASLAGFAGANPATATVTPLASNELFYGGMFLSNASAAFASPFSALSNDASTYVDEDLVQGAAAAQAFIFSNASSGGGSWNIVGATFKASGGAVAKTCTITLLGAGPC